jgi:VCBS repeat-containing protein
MSRVFLNTKTGALSSPCGEPVTRLYAKRGTSWDLEVVPDVEIDEESAGWFSAKATAGGDLLAHGMWTLQEDGTWLFSLSLRGTDLAALFTGSTAQLELLAEGTFVVSGKTRKSQTIRLVVERDIYGGEEIEPGDLENTRRTGEGGYQEYSFDDGVTWYRYAPVMVAGTPEWQWTLVS